MPAPVSLLIPAVEALPPGRLRPAVGLPVAAWQVLSTLPDPRGRRGRRHELATVLAVALAAVLAGAKSLAGIADWAGDQPGWVLARVGVRRRPPSVSTIRRVLLLVDPDIVDAVLHAWLAAMAPPPPVPAAFRAVAVDGKTCRGAVGLDGSGVHLFSIVEHGTGVPLGQVLAPSKGFEIAAFAGGVGPPRPDERGRHRGRTAHPACARRLPAPPPRPVHIHCQGQPADPARPAARPCPGRRFRSFTTSTARATAGANTAPCKWSRSRPGSASRTPASRSG